MALLDNHLTFDVALRVFDFGTREFNDLIERFRTALLEAMAAAGRDSVATLVFADPEDRPYVDRVAATASRCGVELNRVQLCPPPAVLTDRVASGTRPTSNKVRDTETLQGLLTHLDLYAPIDDADLRIDNSELTPEQVVTQIGQHLGL